MARLDGGILSRPSGKVASVIFGAARTREGKVVTAREFVRPSNPRTASQQANRSLFKVAMDTVRQWGPDIYQQVWNRAVGQLPGFQSMLSSVRNAYDENDLFAPSLQIPLGTVPYSGTPTWTEAGDPGVFQVALGEAPAAPSGLSRIGVVVASVDDIITESRQVNATTVAAGATAPSGTTVNVEGMLEGANVAGWAYYIYLDNDSVVGVTVAKPVAGEVIPS